MADDKKDEDRKSGDPAGAAGARRFGQGGAPPAHHGERRTYRAGGVAAEQTSQEGPGSHDYDNRGARAEGAPAEEAAASASESRGIATAAPGEAPGQPHETYGAATGDLGRSWNRPDRGYGQTKNTEGYRGWSGRTGQDYQPEGEQSFEDRSGAWTRGGVAGDAPAEAWHDRGPDAENIAPAGERGTFEGEAAYNQQFREPYGAYQGGYPGEAAAGAKTYAPEYLAWRAEQIRKLDDDYEAWCRERQTAFEPEFVTWRDSRPRAQQHQSVHQEEQAAVTRSGEQGQPPRKPD